MRLLNTLSLSLQNMAKCFRNISKTHWSLIGTTHSIDGDNLMKFTLLHTCIQISETQRGVTVINKYKQIAPVITMVSYMAGGPMRPLNCFLWAYNEHIHSQFDILCWWQLAFLYMFSDLRIGVHYDTHRLLQYDPKIVTVAIRFVYVI